MRTGNSSIDAIELVDVDPREGKSVRSKLATRVKFLEYLNLEGAELLVERLLPLLNRCVEHLEKVVQPLACVAAILFRAIE